MKLVKIMITRLVIYSVAILFKEMQINWNRLKQLNSIRINFIGIVQEDNGAIMFFKIEKLEETTFNFSRNFISII